MAVGYKICIDCAEPHRLARFWAEALDYVVEDHSALVGKLLADGVISSEEVVDVDGRPAFKTAAAVRDAADPVDPFTGTGQGGRVLFQLVPEASGLKTIKNRLHLDLHYGADQVETQVARLSKLGATRLWEAAEGGRGWVVMADPEGNEFCVA